MRIAIASLAMAVLLSAATGAHADESFFLKLADPGGPWAIDVVGAPDGELFALDTQNVYISTSGEPRWALASARPGASTRLEVDPSGRVWALGPASTHLSSDDAATWQLVAGAPVIQRMAFDANGVYFAATPAGVFRSTNLGQTWAPTTLPSGVVGDVFVERPGIVWAGVASQVYRSENAGLDWTPIATLSVSDFARHPQGGVYAAGVYPSAYGLYRITPEAGVTPLGLGGFRIRDLGVLENGVLLAGTWGQCFQGTCWDGGLHRSTDGGVSWQRVSHLGVATRFVQAPSGQIVTASGTYGEDINHSLTMGVLESSDDGATWATRNLGIRPAAITRIAIAPGSGVIAAATQTSLYTSTDRGTTWNFGGDFVIQWGPQYYPRIEPAVFPSGEVVSFLPDALYGSYGGLSVDRTTMTPDGMLLGTLRDGIGFQVGPDQPLVAIPGSPPVNLIEAGPLQRVAAAAIPYYFDAATYIAEGIGPWQQVASIGGQLAWGQDETTLYVADGTSIQALHEPSWTPEPLPALPANVTRVFDIDTDLRGAVYALVPGAVLRLREGDSAWSKLADVPAAEYSYFTATFEFDPDGYLYVATGEGIYRSAGPLGTGTTDGFELGADLVSTVRAYPRPFGSRANIEFALGTRADVDLAVYDVRGRLVANLLRADLRPGPHATTWSPGASVPNGVYVYRLRTHGVERTGRLLLVR